MAFANSSIPYPVLHLRDQARNSTDSSVEANCVAVFELASLSGVSLLFFGSPVPPTIFNGTERGYLYLFVSGDMR